MKNGKEKKKAFCLENNERKWPHNALQAISATTSSIILLCFLNHNHYQWWIESEWDLNLLGDIGNYSKKVTLINQFVRKCLERMIINCFSPSCPPNNTTTTYPTSTSAPTNLCWDLVISSNHTIIEYIHTTMQQQIYIHFCPIFWCFFSWKLIACYQVYIS